MTGSPSGREAELPQPSTTRWPARAKAFARWSSKASRDRQDDSVLRAGIERAREAGVRVLACRSVQVESRMSFAGLGDLLASVDTTELGPLPGPQRHALQVALLREEPTHEPVTPRWSAPRCSRCLAPWRRTRRSWWRSTTRSGWIAPARGGSNSLCAVWEQSACPAWPRCGPITTAAGRSCSRRCPASGSAACAWARCHPTLCMKRSRSGWARR